MTTYLIHNVLPFPHLSLILYNVRKFVLYYTELSPLADTTVSTPGA